MGSPGSFFSFQGTDPISQTKVAELLGEGDSGRTPHEGLGGSVKFEGGDDASVAVEWSGVSLIIVSCTLLLLLLVVTRGSEPTG